MGLRPATGDILMRRFFERFWHQQLGRFWREADAATAVEYAVMLALILVAVMGAIGAVASQAGGMWGSTKNALDSAGFGS
jgi:pilus assembly protein Flp/PilA